MIFDPKKVFNFELEKTLDETGTYKRASPGTGERTEKGIWKLMLTNTDRTFGTIFGSEITKTLSVTDWKRTAIVIKCKGAGGQSFGAFIPKGLTLELTGDSNDYFGKGLVRR